MDWFCQHYPTTTSHCRYSRCGWADPVSTATAVLPPMGQGPCEDSPWPRGEPCRWARRVTPALSCPGGAAAQSDEGAGALGEAARAMLCCLAGQGEKEGEVVGRAGTQGHTGTLGRTRSAERASATAPALPSLPSPCGVP